MTEAAHHAIFARRLFAGRAMLADRFVTIADTTILSVSEVEPPGLPVLQLAADCVLSPGFVDLQVNGGGGILFNDRLDATGLSRIAEAHRRTGTTSMLATLISGSRRQLREALEIVGAAIRAECPGIVGLHLEGPFLAAERRGIHPAASVEAMTPDDLDPLCGDFPGPLLVTLAPERALGGAIQRLTTSGRIVFAGHTAASFVELQVALDEGLAGFTHLFNAMSQMTAREPGAIGAALTDARARAGIILDGLHVHPALARLALAAMGPERLFLVSDAMPTVGSDTTEFHFDGKRIRLVDGRLADEQGTLAGAHLTMAEAVGNAVRLLGCGLEDALRMATSTPASVIGLGDRIGHVGVGYRADMVALDTDLQPIKVWASGRAIPPA
jgi:N-acetylglucosamine-6-phosphate deacetylase